MKTKSLIISIVIFLVLISSWELHWRSEGYKAYHDDDDDLWSHWRRQTEFLSSDDVLIVGSSRAHFDLNTELWGEITGKRPITLASVGTSPGPIIEDLANNSRFNGLLIVSVAPDLFFSEPSSGGWKRLQKRVDYCNKQTYAQRFNQIVFQWIDPHFSYINDNLQLKGLVELLPFPERDSIRKIVYWPDMSINDEYRNLSMIPEMEFDTAMQKAYQNIWAGFGWGGPDTTDNIKLIENYLSNLKTIKDRGGEIIFIRPPSSGVYLEKELENYRRDVFWNVLISKSGFKGYHFMDYPELTGFVCPEWSHLLPDDADEYTRSLIELLEKDNYLK